MQFCKQNMVISLIFRHLKVHSSTNKYFYEKRILYVKSAHSNYGKKVFFKKIWKVGQIHMEVRYRSFWEQFSNIYKFTWEQFSNIYKFTWEQFSNIYKFTYLIFVNL